MRIWLIVLLLFYGLWFGGGNALATPESSLPDDVRYLLEDLYGAERDKWPSPIFAEDVDGDGFTDWVAQERNCTVRDNCVVEVFLCKPGAAGKGCPDYCYLGSGRLRDLRTKADQTKCESTC